MISFQVVDEGEEKYIHLTDPELRKVIGEQIVELLKQKKAQCFPLDSLMLTFTLHYGFMIPLHDLKVATMEELMTKLKHVLKVNLRHKFNFFSNHVEFARDLKYS